MLEDPSEAGTSAANESDVVGGLQVGASVQEKPEGVFCMAQASVLHGTTYYLHELFQTKNVAFREVPTGLLVIRPIHWPIQGVVPWILQSGDWVWAPVWLTACLLAE